MGDVGLKNRIKGLVKAQVRKRLGSFEVRSTPAPSPRPAPQDVTDDIPDGVPKRRVVRAARLADPAPPGEPEATADIRIKARPSRDGEDCTFMVDQVLFDSGSWYFDTAEEAAGSALAERLFALPGINAVLLDKASVQVSTEDVEAGWEALSKAVGGAIRAHLTAGEPAVAEAIKTRVEAAGDLTPRLQTVIDDVINPGVAAHSGHISLSRLRDNSVYVTMGGGCQGCSAAAVTLKQGIHTTFREHVPEVGAIYDDTDHAAGVNPWMS
ncbi:MAG: Fe-S cluster biogenesis protein NfuA [Myxococcota bacterium]|jgi:Fe-S cluster biogenesis protein NfuA